MLIDGILPLLVMSQLAPSVTISALESVTMYDDVSLSCTEPLRLITCYSVTGVKSGKIAGKTFG